MFFLRNYDKVYPISSIFESTTDPRIDFFSKELEAEELSSLIKLRELVFRGTVFENEKMPHDENTLPRYKMVSQGNYAPSKKVYENNESVVKLCMNALIIKKPENKSSNGISHILREQSYGMSWYGYRRGIERGMAIFSVFLAALPFLVTRDENERLAFKAKLENGVCNEQWVPKGCSGQYGTKYDCFIYSPTEIAETGEKCHNPGSVTGLFLILILTLACFAAAQKVYTSRTYKAIEFMHQEFNHSKHDTILNNLCEKKQITALNWDHPIQMSDKSTCSVRTLLMALLVTFNPEAHEKIFSDILPNLKSGNDFEIVIGDESYNVKGITPVSEVGNAVRTELTKTN